MSDSSDMWWCEGRSKINIVDMSMCRICYNLGGYGGGRVSLLEEDEACPWAGDVWVDGMEILE
jgi:hypothetical protein